MFVLIIEKRISAKANAVDWYVLVAVVLPFAPFAELLEIQLAKHVFVKLERVVYNPKNGTFWAQAEPFIHPQPNAKQVAHELVEHTGWDKAMVEKDLEAAKDSLRREAVKKLQSILMKAQTRIVLAGPAALDPSGKGRRH